MQETASVASSDINGVDLSGRFIPDGDPNAAPLTFAEQVAHRAYFLYMDSAPSHGHDVEHWLLAEQQIRAQASPPHKEFSSKRGT
jgi:hypothetical protein